MSVSASYDPEKVVGYLLQRSAATGRSFSKMMRAEVALMVKVGMMSLPPFKKFGDKSFSGQQAVGKAAVRRDINRVYVRPRVVFDEIQAATGDDDVARAYWKALSRGNYAEAKEFIGRYAGAEMGQVQKVGAIDPGYHRWARNSRGRVRPRTLPKQVVTPVSGLNQYAKETAAGVGALKGGLANAAVRLGARGIPAWTRTHGTPGVLSDLADNKHNPSITAQNLSEAADVHWHAVEFGLRNREQRLRRETEAALRRAWR